MTTLLVGFDSAWTKTKSGAIIGALRLDDGRLAALGPPRTVNYVEAQKVVLAWQAEHVPSASLVLLDQPTIVVNAIGQRPVENIVASSVSRRRGGMQPANTSKKEMFGVDAPMWPFLSKFGGAADPFAPVAGNCVFETYPVLAAIALGWTVKDSRTSGRLPKYNPERKRTFSIGDWRHVCASISRSFQERGLVEVVRWVDDAGQNASPRKSDQDGVDACICLLVAVRLADQKACLLVGDRESGYIVVPHNAELATELGERCQRVGREPSAWVRGFRLAMGRG